ncbi:MAG: hypothetical protein PHR37_03025 [Eubacteriales bacterium]|nr:hypothetical protein [Eubacteriales bacterium]
MNMTIEMQFDEEMLDYIQDLQLKTVTFGGYDREDVYAQIRALINKAREVCSSLTESAVNEAEQSIIRNLGSQSVLDSSLTQDGFMTEDYSGDNTREEEMRVAESTIEALQRELQAVEAEAQDARSREQNAVKALNQEKLDYQRKLQDLQNELKELQQKNEELQKQKTEEEQRKETMDQASAILREARLEGARLIDDARAKIDQEILLGRALSKEEESKAKKDIAVLSEELDELVKACQKNREYLRQSKSLLNDVLKFAETGEDIAASALERSDNEAVNAILDRHEKKPVTAEEWQEEDEYWQEEIHHDDLTGEEQQTEDVWHPESEWQPNDVIHSEEDRKTEEDILEGLSYEEGEQTED